MNIVRPTRYGQMIFDDRDIYQGRSFLLYGEYSEGEPELFRKILSPGNIVVEVGANIGSHTLPLSQIVGPRGLVIAIEPERTNFYTLCGNVALNNLTNVRCLQKAVGDHAGTIRVPELDRDRTDNFGCITLDADYSGVMHYMMDLIPLDELHLPRCEFLKIDVEGMEEQVLRGATSFIAKHRPLLYVENDRQEKSGSLAEFILDLGYEMHIHAPPFFREDNYLGRSENVFGNLISVNMLCVPSERELDTTGMDTTLIQIPPSWAERSKLVANDEGRMDLIKGDQIIGSQG